MQENETTSTAESTALVPEAETVLPDAKPTFEDDDQRALAKMQEIRKAKVEAKPEDDEPTVEAAVPAKPKEEPKVEEKPKKSGIEARLAELVKARQEKASAKQDYAQARAALEHQQREFYTQAQQMQAQIDQQRRHFEEERQRWIREVSSNPIKLVTDHGYSADDIIRNIQLSDDPTYQQTQAMRQKLAEVESKLEAERQEREQFAAQERTQREQYAQAQAARAHQQAVHQVLNVLATPDKAPAMRALYDEGEIIERIQRTAEDYQKRTGEVAPLDELVEYCESQAHKRLSAIAPASQKPAQGRGTTRTLNAAAASERRATPMSVKDMTPEEQDEYLKSKMAEIRSRTL